MIVSLQRVSSYDEPEILRGLRLVLDPLGGMRAFVREGQRVLLKLNLLGAYPPDRAITTHPALVRAVSILVIEAGGRVSIGDSPGIGRPRAALEKCGILEAVKDLPVDIADFENGVEFEEMSNKVARKIFLAKALKDCDVVITLPKLKTHAQMGFTGALKNQFGFVPGLEKAKYHYRMRTREWLAALMIDINRIVKPSLAIMDAIVGMEGEGPAGGSPRFIGALIAGSDPVAVDEVACRIVGIRSEALPLMAAARSAGFGDTKEIAIEGVSIEELAIRDFRKIPELLSPLRMIPLPKFFLEWLQRQISPRPRIIQETCIKCGACKAGCPVDPSAIDPFLEEPAVFDDLCIRCYCCHEFCPVKAIRLEKTGLGRLLRMASHRK